MVVAVLVAVAGCGGGSSHEDVSPNWSAPAVATTKALSNKLAAAFKGDCTDYGTLDRVTYLSSAGKIHSTIVPQAVANCTVLTEGIEISIFPSAATRDAFIKQRSDILCARAAKAKVVFPGLHWVVASNWSMQPDSEGVSRRIAAALDAKYVLRACPKAGPVDWDATATEQVDQLGAAIQHAGLGCNDFQLVDRELYSHNPHYVAIGLPGSYARCTVGSDPNISIASFRGRDSEKIGTWVPKEIINFCAQEKTTRTVIGNDFVVFVPDGKNVSEIAAAVKGKPYGGPCPAS